MMMNEIIIGGLISSFAVSIKNRGFTTKFGMHNFSQVSVFFINFHIPVITCGLRYHYGLTIDPHQLDVEFPTLGTIKIVHSTSAIDVTQAACHWPTESASFFPALRRS